MGVYSQMTIEDINEILALYEFGAAKSFNATAHGISNSNYHVILESGKEILLKVSNDKDFKQLENEQRILHVLKKHDYPYSPDAFKTIKDELVYQYKDHHGVIFPFIHGHSPKVTPDVCDQMGRALAMLHSLDIDREDLESIRPYAEVGFGAEAIYQYVKSENALEDFVEAFNEIFGDSLTKEIPYDMFPGGIIHGDLYFDNSLFDEGVLATLLDFEQAGRGRFILDIGISLSGGCLTEDGQDIDDQLVDHFLTGYEQVRILATLEKEYLSTAILVGFFSIALWRIKRFYLGKLDSSKKYNYRDLINKALNYHRRIKKGPL